MLRNEDSKASNLSSAQLIALSFMIAILIGGALLSLPFSHAEGKEVNVLDALFTATSALCVTGLTVVDTGTSFSPIGQVIIALLIQLGGFGIITAGTAVTLLSGRRIGFRERLNLQAQVNTMHVGGIVSLIRRILLLIFTLELIGALLLLPSFIGREGIFRGTLYAIFHSVSAFNNAGFGLYSDNLMSFVSDPLVNFTIMALIILGGLGFLVETDVLRYLLSRDEHRRKLFLHTQLVLITSATLIVVGAIVILIFEWGNENTLGSQPWYVKILASIFQSVTPRTAGFNTLDYGKMLNSTLIITMVLMFIGGSPGSTAGGIKTATAFVLLGSAWSISRGKGELVIFGRKIDFETVVRAGSIAMLSSGLVVSSIILLGFTDPTLDFFHLSFEAFSAFGTVGLSAGITSSLSPWSKVVILFLMYLGRIGPLTFANALIESQVTHRVDYPKENVLLG